MKIYLIEFLEKGWIEWDEKRPNAYRITNKGILAYDSEELRGQKKIASINEHTAYMIRIIAVVVSIGILIFVVLNYLRGC